MNTTTTMTDGEAFITLGELILRHFDPHDTFNGVLDESYVEAILTAQRALVERIARNTPKE